MRTPGSQLSTGTHTNQGGYQASPQDPAGIGPVLTGCHALVVTLRAWSYGVVVGTTEGEDEL